MRYWRVYDNREKSTSRREYKTRKAAQRRADKLNIEYGAHRYSAEFA